MDAESIVPEVWVEMYVRAYVRAVSTNGLRSCDEVE